GKSTIRIDFEAAWLEPVDDLSANPQPIVLNGNTNSAFSITPRTGDTLAKIAGQHEFHDTKHRNVAYTAVATTRFREYFPDALAADPANLTRRSLPQTVSVPSSARPSAPKVLYVLPTFGWQAGTSGAWNVSTRAGASLRVYLGRPWFSSGEGELLGAVLWQC